MPAPLPLALGLISLPGETSVVAQSRARVAMGTYAFDEGYALFETFHVCGRPVHDDGVMAAIVAMVERIGPSRVLAADDVPNGFLARVERLPNVVMVRAPAAVFDPRHRHTGTARGAARSQTRSKLAR